MFLDSLIGNKRSVSVIPSNIWRPMNAIGGETPTGVTVTPDIAMTYSAVYACVRIISESIAAMPFVTYERDGENRKRAVDFHLYPILHDVANDEMSSFELRETLISHVLTWGNGYAEIEFDRAGRVIGLWPLLPNRTQPVRINDELFYWLTLPDGETKLLSNDRVLHLRGLSYNGLTGLSPIGLQRRAIGLGIAAEEFGSRFFGNDARPGGIIQHPGELSDVALTRLKTDWKSEHGGLSRAHRVGILEEGMSYQEIGVAPEDAQFLETRKFQVEEIARIYRVPPHMLADLDRATFSNIEQQSISFVVNTLGAWLVRIEKTINRVLLTPDERKKYFVEHLVDSLMRGDITSRYAAYATAKQNGWMSTNEIRRLENMNGIGTDGDEYFVPLNMLPLSQAVQGVKSSNDDGSFIDDDDDSRAGLPVKWRGRPLPANISVRSFRSGVERNRLEKSHRRVYIDVIGRILRREANDVGNAAKRLVKPGQPTTEFDAWLTEFYENHRDFAFAQMLPVAIAFAENVASVAGNEVGSETDAGQIERYVRSYLATWSRRHSLIQADRIRRKFDKDADEILPEIETELETWRDETRAESIAHEETNRTNNAVAIFVYTLAGILRKTWLTFGENCPYCDALNGKTVGLELNFAAAGEGFAPGGVAPLVPSSNIGHPPIHRGCDCVIISG